jgi:hypothetical protein
MAQQGFSSNGTDRFGEPAHPAEFQPFGDANADAASVLSLRHASRIPETGVRQLLSRTGQSTPQPEPAGRPGGPAHSASPADPNRGDRSPADGPPRRRRRTTLYAGLGLVVLVAVVATATLVVVGRHSGAGGQSGPSMISALTGSAPAAAAPTSAAAPGPSPMNVPPPIIPGYQVVPIPARGAVYDAPRDWALAPGTTSWGTAPNTLDVAGLTQDGASYCPNHTRTSVFLTTSAQSDPNAAAAEVGTRMVHVGWSTATGVTPGRSEQLASLDGQLHGAFAETSGTTAPTPGCATTFSIYTFAFPNENGSFVMTIAADTGVAKSVDRETARRVLASIRPLPDH